MAREIRFKNRLGQTAGFEVPASKVKMQDGTDAETAIRNAAQSGGGGSAELPGTIIETEENGFFLVDENLNIGGFATANGSNIITAAVIGENL